MSLLLVTQSYILISDRLWFSNAVSEFKLEIPLTSSSINGLFQTPQKISAHPTGRQFIAEQVIYKKYAEKIVEENISTGATIFTIDLGEISNNTLYPKGLHYLQKKNYHSAFLAFYTSDTGLNLAYVQAIDSNSQQPIYASGYRGERRLFPAQLKLEGGRPVYKNPEHLKFKLRSTGPGKAKAYLATTKEELDWLLQYLKNKGEDMKIVQISHN
jgi:hypothetical protein